MGSPIPQLGRVTQGAASKYPLLASWDAQAVSGLGMGQVAAVLKHTTGKRTASTLPATEDSLGVGWGWASMQQVLRAVRKVLTCGQRFISSNLFLTFSQLLKQPWPALLLCV